MRFEGYKRGVNFGGWLSQCVSYDKEHFESFIQKKDIRREAERNFKVKNLY